MKIALIDYGAGNLHSAAKALERALIEAGLSGHIVLGANPDEVATADRIVLPGDGAYRDCREHLAEVDGLEDVLNEQVRIKGRPFLGICVGMQLLSDIGEERGETQGLGWIPGRVVALDPQAPEFQARHLKVPHMGWNTLERRGDHPVLDGLSFGEGGLHAYFLHSYHLLPTHPADLLATADYGGPVSAIVGRDTVVGTQFHPEKSQALGIRLLANFVKWSP
ncbi:MAG: hypothetical protein FD175_444 [Beijerinckiaceae bacterium]|nr:MAG: hypothetical protein FD175_444 [Beijerinckiaceae bacterium]